MVGAGTGDAHIALSVPEGTARDAWGSVNESVRVMQAASDVDFQLEAKFNADPTDGYNDQGIIVEQDASNWLRFDVYDVDTNAGEKLFVGKMVGGATTIIINANIADGAANYLRVTRSGNDWELHYSADGSTLDIGCVLHAGF